MGSGKSLVGKNKDRVIFMRTTSQEDQIEVYLSVDRLLNGLYGMWSSKKMTLYSTGRGHRHDFLTADEPF